MHPAVATMHRHQRRTRTPCVWVPSRRLSGHPRDNYCRFVMEFDGRICQRRLFGRHLPGCHVLVVGLQSLDLLLMSGTDTEHPDPESPTSTRRWNETSGATDRANYRWLTVASMPTVGRRDSDGRNSSGPSAVTSRSTRVAIVANAIVSSRRANRIPMQWRGPPLNGK